MWKARWIKKVYFAYVLAQLPTKCQRSVHTPATAHRNAALHDKLLSVLRLLRECKMLLAAA